MTSIVTRARPVGVALLFVAAVTAADSPPAPAAAASPAVASCPAAALSPQPYFQSASVDLIDVIPPPPPPGSAAAARDLEAVLDAQRVARQLGTVARAIADADVNCLRFADVLGPNFSAARAPLAVYFLNRAAIAGASASGPGKTYWWRARPYVLSPRVERLADVAPDAIMGPGPLDDFRAACRPGEPPRAPKRVAEIDPQRGITSYPSGHSAFGTSCAILLAEMVPEQRAALFARARQYGEARLIVGAHYPTDVESGRIVAAVAAAAMQQNAAFRHDFEAARIELRAALGLPRDPPDLKPQKPAPQP
jgi:acid phosphatase (class A)